MGSFHILIAAASVALAYGGALGADRLLDEIGAGRDAQVQVDGALDAGTADDEEMA